MKRMMISLVLIVGCGGPTPVPNLLTAHNQERAKVGLGPLVVNPLLTKIAQSQAAYCKQINTLTHIGPGGSNVGQRATAVGYKWSRIGENAAMSPDPMTIWMHSPLHKANILGPYKEIGIGVASPYTTVAFGSR